jgi:hypothetical protein
MAAAPDYTCRTLDSPDGSLRLEMDSEWDDRDGPRSMLLIKTGAGETLFRLGDAAWEDNPASPVFSGAVIELDLNYCGYRCRVRIDTAARTFVFHPNEIERPLSELVNELGAAAFPRVKAVAARQSRRVTLVSWLTLLGNFLFVAAGAWILCARQTFPKANPWVAVLCILFFGLCAAVELRELWRNK